MNDYQRGLLRAAEICENTVNQDEFESSIRTPSTVKLEAYNEACNDCTDAIRAEAEKVATDAPDEALVKCRICSMRGVECSRCGGDGDEPNTDNDVTGPAACSKCGGSGIIAPSVSADEALIEEIADRKADQYLNWNNPLPLGTIIVLAIHEYIDLKRREGK